MLYPNIAMVMAIDMARMTPCAQPRDYECTANALPRATPIACASAACAGVSKRCCSACNTPLCNDGERIQRL